MYAVAPAIPLPAGAHERQQRLHERAIKVFGDLDVTWLHRWDRRWGLDEAGAPRTPHQYAADGEAQLQELLEVLAELSKTVTSRWDERPSRKRGPEASRSRGR